jgi:histidyl-tRNA synthetase
MLVPTVSKVVHELPATSEKSIKVRRCTFGDNVKSSRRVQRMVSPIHSVESVNELDSDSDKMSLYNKLRSVDLTNKKNVKTGTKLSSHHKIYMHNRPKNMTFLEAKEYLTLNRIGCAKYNYSLEKEVQNFSTFDGEI